MRQPIKALIDHAGAGLMLAFVRLRLSLSAQTSERMVRAIAWLALRAVPSRRRIAARNLRRAFGKEKTPQELNGILEDAYRQFIRMFMEMLLLFKQERSVFTSRVHIEGFEHLKRAMAQGRGVIGVSAHYGPFAMLAAVLPQHGIPFHVLYRRPKSSQTAKLFDDFLEKAGGQVIEDTPRHLSGVRCLQALSRGAFVCLFIDQHFPAGVQVPFFGVPSKTGIGAALLAARSQAPLVPLVVRRRPNGDYQLIIEPALSPPQGRSREALTACMTELTRLVEKWIREEPSPWFWVHRRWKDLDQAEQSAE